MSATRMRLRPIPMAESNERIEVPGDKSALERIARILAAIVALSTMVLAQWNQHPWFTAALVLVALLLVVSAFGPGIVRFSQVSSAQSRRDKFAREQFPEFSELVKRFAKLTDSSDGKSIRNVLFYGCGSNQTEFDRLCSPDYFKEIWPHFFARLGKRSRNEAEFRNALKEFYTLAASYNNNYVLEPFKRMKNKQWMPATTSSLTPELKSWLSSLPEHHRTGVEAQIEDFRERWVSYLDDLVPFLDRLHDSLGTSSSRIESYFERPSKV